MRCQLTDGSGKWFETNSALEFSEDTIWDGNNQVSRATGSQWCHEVLYYTKSGKWILHSWSQWQGSVDSYLETDEGEAVHWLITQNCSADNDIEKLPQEVQDLIEKTNTQLEI